MKGRDSSWVDFWGEDFTRCVNDLWKMFKLGTSAL